MRFTIERKETSGVTHAGAGVVAAVLKLIPNPRHYLPHIHQALPVAEATHKTLIALAAAGRRIDCPELTGQNRLGQPLTRGHRHAHLIPLDVDDDCRIEHILVYAPMGLGIIAQRAVKQISTLRLNPRHVLLSRRDTFIRPHQGEAADAMRVDVRLGRFLYSAGHSERTETTHVFDANDHSRNACQRIFHGSRSWTSLTPFVAPRFVKRSGKNTIEGQIESELRSRGLPTPSRIDVLMDTVHGTDGFCLMRGPGKRFPPQRIGYAIRLHFPSPLFGPIALGYAAHFGLGVFRADS